MIEVNGLTKSFGSLLAVDGVTFSIARGETFGMLGPNGAGKTTTIAMLVGSIAPDAGKLSVNGHSDLSDPESRRTIGVAPQANAVYGELSGRENIAFFGRVYGFAGLALKERVQAALEFVGLSDRGDDKVNHYSGGMKRRLNLGCALVHEPEIIVLDEPTVGVDPQSRNFIFDNIEALKKQGRTILYTTHYMEEVERLCDRVAIMDKGRVVALDTVAKLIEAHGGDGVIELLLEPGDNGSMLPADRTIIANGRLTMSTRDPKKDFSTIVESGLRFTEMQLRKPNLETVFLNLTGRQLRD